jgi:ABC-type transport system involved in multi-copper enzyme maturation permease subunit
MFKAILYKDYLLLRIYLRISVLISFLLYPVGFGIVLWVTETYLDRSERSIASQLRTTLAGASIYGLVLTCLFSSIIAASTIALERSDRSSEFLACLPPTRWQNLSSKLLILLSFVVGMLVLHNTATYLAWFLSAYARSNAIEISFIGNLSITCVILCITGFSFAGSSLMKSNGGPALMGLLSPLLSLSIASGIGELMEAPSEGSMFAIRYAATSAILGVTMLLCGSLWYLNRSEP